MGWTTRKKLITVEVVYFIVDGAVLLLYWYGVLAGINRWVVNAAFGCLFTAQFIVAGISTYLWFGRTDEGNPSGAGRQTEPAARGSPRPAESPSHEHCSSRWYGLLRVRF